MQSFLLHELLSQSASKKWPVGSLSAGKLDDGLRESQKQIPVM